MRNLNSIICIITLLFPFSYSITLTKDKAFLSSSTKSIPCHIGCFKEGSPRDLNVEMGKVSKFEECNVKCASYKFFAMQYTGECRCSNDTNRKYGSQTCPSDTNLNGPFWGGMNNYVWERKESCTQ